MTKIKNFHFLCLALLFSLAVVGCMTLAKKRATDQQANTSLAAQQDTLPPYKTIDEYLKLVGTTCPKVLWNQSKSGIIGHFSYRLDTTDTPNCRAARTMEDLIGEGRLFPLGEYDEIKKNADGEYQQYYKGVPVQETHLRVRQSANGKIIQLKGAYYPALDVDTAGLISREEAAKIAYKAVGIDYPNAYIDKIFSIHPPKFAIYLDLNKILYTFSFVLAKDRVLCNIDATAGKLYSITPAIVADVCYKCAGTESISLPCPACSLNVDLPIQEYQMLEVPTLYNGCQGIRADKFIDSIPNIHNYRLSPNPTPPLDITDSINIYDYSQMVGGAYMPSPIYMCYSDSLIYTTGYIAGSLYYGFEQIKAYFHAKGINYNKRLTIASKVGVPANAAAWDPILNAFLFSHGDGITINPPVSVDIAAHEYGHYMLQKFFNIPLDTNYKTRAIHEGVADIFSVLARRHINGTSGNSIDWTIGTDVALAIIDNYFPRDLVHPENTDPPQALYYKDTTNIGHWNPLDTVIYNHAGIIAKWFYLLTNGGTGARYGLPQPLPNNSAPIDSIVVDSIGIEYAEKVLIAGLTKLDEDEIAAPTYEQFAEAMADTAKYIIAADCDVRKSVVKAWKAVGLLLATPDGKTDDETLCFIDLQMRDNDWDTGMEPNIHSIMPGEDGIYNTGDEWEAIWHSPDLWNCTNEEQCTLEQWHQPQGGVSNEMGFSIYNADPALNSDPAGLYLHFSFAGTGETWPGDWNSYFAPNCGCLLGGMLPGCPIAIPPIAPQDRYTGWFSWTPPDFFNPASSLYCDPFFCSELAPINFGTDSVKYEMCLLARLDSPGDPLEENNGAIADNIYRSNNIVTRNAFLIDPAWGGGGGLPPMIPGQPSVILMTNNNDDPRLLDLLFDDITGGSVEAFNSLLEVSFVLSPTLWEKWESTGAQGEGVQIVGTREVKISNMETAKLLDIPFDPREFQPFAIKVTILTSSGKRETLNYLPDEFSFRVTHSSSDGSPINKPSNCLFYVNDLHKQAQSVQTLAETLHCSPNPFSTQLNVQFYLSKAEAVTLGLYDLQGRLVKTVQSNEILAAGTHNIRVNGQDLPVGVYLCSLTTSDKQLTEKVVLVR